MSITIVITNAGRAALVNAQNTGTAPVTVAACGVSPAFVVAAPAATTLPGEVKRITTLSGDAVAGDTIHLIVRDESMDAFPVRSFALYLGDGTLFAIYGQADPILEKTAQSLMLLAVDVKFADIDAASLIFGDTNFLNPPATEGVKGVAAIATQNEVFAASDDSRIVTPKKLYTAVLAWLNAWGVGIWRASNDGAGSGLDADLLDGQQGSWYSNIVERLGYTPVNRAGDTMTGSLATPYIEVTAGDVYLSRTSEAWGYILRPDVAGFKNLQFATAVGGALDNIELNSTIVTVRGNAVWHAGNDGAGSALDADLLDGRQAAEFALLTGATYSGVVAVAAGGAVATVGDSGSFTSAWADGVSGLYYFGVTGGRYLHYNGTSYFLNGAELHCGPGNALVWNAGNDGTGSGLDADLLDGQQGSWYADILARLGWTPLNKGGDTLTGKLRSAGALSGNSGLGTAVSDLGSVEILGNGVGAALMTFHRPGQHAAYFGLDTDNRFKVGGWSMGPNAFDLWHAGNDGAGSGLDADLLDGHDSGFFADIPSRLGFMPVRQGGGSGQGSNTVYIGWAGSRLKAQVDGLDLGNITFDGNVADVWRASNDGSGSGLDADLLDGLEGAAYTKNSDFTSGQNANGYWRRLPDGRMEMWGTATLPASYVNTSSAPIAFPAAFSDANSVRVNCTAVGKPSDTWVGVTISLLAAPSTAGCDIVGDTCAGGDTNGRFFTPMLVHWRAIGI